MKKFAIELPKGRLELRLKLIKRRRPLVPEPLFPSLKTVKRKYRSGSLLGRIVRHISEHRSAKKVVVGNLAAFAMVGAFLPGSQSQSFEIPVTEVAGETIIQSQNTLKTQKSLQYPLDNVKINQGYSYFHPGVDLGAPVGVPVKPIKAGSVIEAGYSNYGYGNTVLIDHTNGLVSRYAHLTKIEVTNGENVTTETEIGTVGTTGRSSGPHLHLEVLNEGKSINPINYLSK